MADVKDATNTEVLIVDDMTEVEEGNYEGEQSDYERENRAVKR